MKVKPSYPTESTVYLALFLLCAPLGANLGALADQNSTKQFTSDFTIACGLCVNAPKQYKQSMNIALQYSSVHSGVRLRTAAFSSPRTSPSPVMALRREGRERRRPTPVVYLIVETAHHIPLNVSGIHLFNPFYVFSCNVFQTYQLRPWYAYLCTLYGDFEAKMTTLPTAGSSDDPVGPTDTSPASDQPRQFVVAEPCSTVQIPVYYMSLSSLNVGTVYKSCLAYMYYLLTDFGSVCYRASDRTKCIKRHNFVVTSVPHMLGLYHVILTGHNTCRYLAFCNNRIHTLERGIFNSYFTFNGRNADRYIALCNYWMYTVERRISNSLTLSHLSYTITSPTVLRVTSRLCPELYSLASSVCVTLLVWRIPKLVPPASVYNLLHYMFSVCIGLLCFSSTSVIYEAIGHVSLLRRTSALEHVTSHPYATTDNVYATRTSAVLQQVGPSFHRHGIALEDPMLPSISYIVLLRTLSMMVQMRIVDSSHIMMTVSLLLELLRHAKYHHRYYAILIELSLSRLLFEGRHTLKYMRINRYMLLSALTTISETYHIAAKQYKCHIQPPDLSYVEYKSRTYSQVNVVTCNDDFTVSSGKRPHPSYLEVLLTCRPIPRVRTDEIITCRWKLLRSSVVITSSFIDASSCLILIFVLLFFIYNAERNEADLIVTPYVCRKPHSRHIYAYSSHPYLPSKYIEDPTKKSKLDAPQTSLRRILYSDAAADMSIPNCMCKVNIPPVRPDGTDVYKMTCFSCQCQCEGKASPNLMYSSLTIGMVILSGLTLRYVFLLCFIVISLLENVYIYTRWIETT